MGMQVAGRLFPPLLQRCTSNSDWVGLRAVQEKQGELLETYIIDGGVVCGKAFKLPGARCVCPT